MSVAGDPVAKTPRNLSLRRFGNALVGVRYSTSKWLCWRPC
jgi:hypothetical protein